MNQQGVMASVETEGHGVRLLPSKIGFNVANVSYTTQMQRQFEPTVACSTYNKDLKLNQGIQTRVCSDQTDSGSDPIPLPSAGTSLTIPRLENPTAFSISSTTHFSRGLRIRHGAIIIFSRTKHPGHSNSRRRSIRRFSTGSPAPPTIRRTISGQLTKYGSDSTQNFMNATVNSGVDFNSGLTMGPSFQSLSGIKGIDKAAGVMKKGFDLIGFNSLNFSYSATGNLTNDNLGADFLSSQNVNWTDFMAYQMGLEGRSLSDIISGTMNDQSALGGMRYRLSPGTRAPITRMMPGRSINPAQFSTSFSLPKPIDLQISFISLKWNRQYSVRPDTTFYDTTWTYPDLSITAQSHVLDKIGLITRYIPGANLSSGFSLRENGGVILFLKRDDLNLDNRRDKRHFNPRSIAAWWGRRNVQEVADQFQISAYDAS